MIKLTNVYKAFGEKKVLENFNATFDYGATCVMGNSGSGKTTLANLILGLLKPDSGEISGTSGKRMSCVFQENRLIEEVSTFKNLMLVSDKKNTDRAMALLACLGLESSADCPVSTLSGGMKRRTAIARALLNNADIYIFDEPFAGLDGMRKESVIDIIKSHTQNAVSIFITHEYSDVELLNAKLLHLDGQ